MYEYLEVVGYEYLYLRYITLCILSHIPVA